MLTVREVAEQLKCSEQSVRRKCEAGELAACNIGGRKRRVWRVAPEALEEFVRRGGVR